MLGDIVQFTRFAQGIVARGKRPVFEVLQSLAPLIAQADNVRRVMREGKAFPETGLHIPVFDLLSIFAGHLGGNALYIVTDPDNAERWSDRILKPNESVSVLSGPGAQHTETTATAR